jgi:hypothetical protein
MAVEKSLGNKGQGAIADGDIACFYDEQQVILIFDWLLKRCPPVLAAAAVKLQLYPKIMLCCGSTSVVIPNRSRGKRSSIAMLLSYTSDILQMRRLSLL